MKISLRVFIACFTAVLALPSVVHAGIVDGLNQSRVAVANQSISTQRTATRQAMRQVLVKMSGTDDLLGHPTIRSSVSDADRYLKSYEFVSADNKLYLSASFNESELQSLILEAGFPIWDRRRPDSLVWLVSDEKDIAGQGQIISEYTVSQRKNEIENGAKRRGIPLIFPIMDLDDIQAVNEYDIWGLFAETIEAASSRYQADYVMAARIETNPRPVSSASETEEETESETASDDPTALQNTSSSRQSAFSEEELLSQQDKLSTIGPNAQWMILKNGKITTGQLTGADADELTQGLIDVLADTLAARYAINLDNIDKTTKKMQFTVLNTKSFSDFVGVQRFLEGLSIVERANLISQTGESSVFELTMIGTEDNLRNILSLDENLIPKVDQFGMPVAALEYYWQR